jgi:hypothetical protein
VVISDLSNSYFACFVFLLPYPLAGFGRPVVASQGNLSLSYDVAGLIKGRVSLAKHARSSSRNPMRDVIGCGKKPCLGGGQTCPSFRGQHIIVPRARRRDMPSCPSMQRYLSIYPSIHPSIHRIGGGMQGSMRVKRPGRVDYHRDA